jgi:hypothetical protein
MAIAALFGLGVLMSFVAFGIVTRLYIWPRVEACPAKMRLPHWRLLTCFASLG